MPQCPRCGFEGTGAYCSNCGVAYATGKAKGGLSGCAIAGIVAAALGCLAIPFIGMIAAIAIPNFLNAVERGKQKRTMADMRTVATAIEGFAADKRHYPATQGWVDVEDLRPLLEPTYANPLPAQDGWQRPMEYQGESSGYTLRSRGKNWVVDNPPPRGPTPKFDNDILFENGDFASWPEGTQGP
jgi:type II secretory pathway pseudopilin PulG